MSDNLSRRKFVGSTLTAGAIAGFGDFAFLDSLPHLSAKDVDVKAKMVQFDNDVEPLVRMIEDTPQNKVIDRTIEQIRKGTTYQQLLAAVMLAGVRGIQPRPVGFEFHTVLVINSAHLATLAAQDRDRWLPLLWAVDNFKDSQATKRRKNSDWRLWALEESKLPPAHKARETFIDAMDNWDPEKADVAIAALVRQSSAVEIGELFWRYGARDFRDIGHKAIFAANGWRTLQTIGWRHAEPIMRSMTFALLDHEGDNPAKRNDARDVPWRENIQRAKKIRKDWHKGKLDRQAAVEMLERQRNGSSAEASQLVVELLNRKIDPACVWDGLFLTAGELLMRKPGIGALHCVTTLNALYFAYQTSGNDETRRMMMLQAAAFLPMFQKFIRGRGKLAEVKIDQVEPVAPPKGESISMDQIYREVSDDPMLAAQMTMRLLADNEKAATDLMSTGRRLIFTKGTNSHDYKFSSAALEDFYHVTPMWRDRYLASSLFQMRGAKARDNTLIQRAKASLEKS